MIYPLIHPHGAHFYLNGGSLVKKPLLILISGKKGTGKDTFATFFRGTDFISIAFADALKSQLYAILNEILQVTPKINLGDMYNDKDKIINIPLADGNRYTIRYWLQQYGQYMKNIFGFNYWSDILINQIQNHIANENVIVTDVRFPYEIDRLKEKMNETHNILMIRIHRNTWVEDLDISEIALNTYPNSNFNYIVDNNESLEELKLRAEKIKNELLK